VTKLNSQCFLAISGAQLYCMVHAYPRSGITLQYPATLPPRLLTPTLQMVADLAQWPRIKGVAAALQVAPAMKVFTAHQGYQAVQPFVGRGRDHPPGARESAGA
jgi:hypothetical protein